jgi:hypothetical protein
LMLVPRAANAAANGWRRLFFAVAPSGTKIFVCISDILMPTG